MNVAVSIDSAVISISVEILEGIEPVRNHPCPYYIGSRGTANIHKLFGKLFLNRVAINGRPENGTLHNNFTRSFGRKTKRIFAIENTINAGALCQ